jgi:tRNA 2-thiouridine synthesizing protein C
MKSFLFVLRKPPHSGAYVQEMLDMILTAAAFDQSVNLLLLDDAVFALKNRQTPQSESLKDTAAIFNALEIYEVNELYVEMESLQERGLRIQNLSLPVKTCFRSETNRLMQRYDVIIPG